MFPESQNLLPGTWAGWSTISANMNASFTIWLTGLSGTGKTTLASFLKKALVIWGYNVEIIDTQTLSHWMNLELVLKEELWEDTSHTLGYDAFVTYVCTLLSRNNVICITSFVSPFTAARNFAREQISKFVEVYLYCSDELREKRLRKLGNIPAITPELYQPPTKPELSIDTSEDYPERSTMHLISYLEQYSYLAPLWEDIETDNEEIASIKTRLQAMGYLE